MTQLDILRAVARTDHDPLLASAIWDVMMEEGRRAGSSAKEASTQRG